MVGPGMGPSELSVAANPQFYTPNVHNHSRKISPTSGMVQHTLENNLLTPMSFMHTSVLKEK